MRHDIHSGHDVDDMSLPPMPSSAAIGAGGMAIVVLAICTSLMQGIFVTTSSHDMHVWPSVNSTKVELPPFNPGNK